MFSVIPYVMFSVIKDVIDYCRIIVDVMYM